MLAGLTRGLSIGACLWGASATASLESPPADSADHVPARVIVRFRPGLPIAAEDEILAGLGSSRLRRIPHVDVQLVELRAGGAENACVDALRALPEVEFAEMERLVRKASVTANDPLFTNQRLSLEHIRVPQAWSMCTGSASVKIAFLDTGVDGAQADLAPNMVPGWNFVDNNGNTQDLNGHGTTSVGVAAAAGNNGIGIAGIAWNSKIMPIRVEVQGGVASVFDLADGLVWASDHGARVASMGFMVGDTTGSAVSTAAQYFQSRGGVVIAPSGNNGQYSNTPNDPYILIVSGISYSNDLYPLSNVGTHVDLTAPAQLWTTSYGGVYYMMQGTSFASAAVAGVAALALSADPSLTGVELRDLLIQSADDLGTGGWDSSFGWGRVNAERAVTMALGGGGPPSGDTQAPTVQITAPQNQSHVSGRVTIQASASDNVGVTRVEFYVDGALVGTDASAPYRYAWQTNHVSQGAHSLVCKAFDAPGNFGTSPTVTVLR